MHIGSCHSLRQIKSMKNHLSFFSLFILTIFLFAACNGATADYSEGTEIVESEDGSILVKDALPFTLEFEEASFDGENSFPAIGSYSIAAADNGQVLLLGGSTVGTTLVKEYTGKKLREDDLNNFLYVLDFESGEQWSFDLNQLSVDLSAPLQSVSQQYYSDRSTGHLYIVGGFGWNSDSGKVDIYDQLIRVEVKPLIEAVKTGATAAEIEELFEWIRDERLAVAGGQLFRLKDHFFLIMGQRMQEKEGDNQEGEGAHSLKYTEEIRSFTIDGEEFAISDYNSSTNTEFDRPFHRKNFHVIADIHPQTGNEIIGIYGGGFPPGEIDLYSYPIHIFGPRNIVVERGMGQNFSQYQSPVISVFDELGEEAIVHHSFFGGIGRYYYSQSDSQKKSYELAAESGKNHGMPFTSDISTLQIKSVTGSEEFIHPQPIPDNRLLGIDARFVLHPNLKAGEQITENGVLLLSAVEEGDRKLIGYIFGGTESDAPFPEAVDAETWATHSLFKVYLQHRPSDAIPADQGFKSEQDISGTESLTTD